MLLLSRQPQGKLKLKLNFFLRRDNHNILQGVADLEQRSSDDQAKTISYWVELNTERFWTRDGGVLLPRSQGGADVIIVDDPRMPNTIDIAKNLDPQRSVIFHSHIQIRADLANILATPTAGVWN